MDAKLKVVVFGARGWIGGYMLPMLEENNFHVIHAPSNVRADDIQSVEQLLDEVRPERVLSLIGRTHGEGYNTIDYLEQPGKLVENIRDNLFSPVVLAHACAVRGIHFTYMGTGCIFSADDPVNGQHYSETSDPDFFGSSYSVVKGFTDRIMRHVFNANTLNVRIRMPITYDLSDRNFITKITKYEKVCSIPNSMTILPVMLPLLCKMIATAEIGTINLVNPGYISHNEILEMYKEIVDPTFTWKNFSIEEQNEILLSKRSNNVLDTSKVQSMFPELEDIHVAMKKVMHAIACSDRSTK